MVQVTNPNSFEFCVSKTDGQLGVHQLKLDRQSWRRGRGSYCLHSWGGAGLFWSNINWIELNWIELINWCFDQISIEAGDGVEDCFDQISIELHFHLLLKLSNQSAQVAIYLAPPSPLLTPPSPPLTLSGEGRWQGWDVLPLSTPLVPLHLALPCSGLVSHHIQINTTAYNWHRFTLQIFKAIINCPHGTGWFFYCPLPPKSSEYKQVNLDEVRCIKDDLRRFT